MWPYLEKLGFFLVGYGCTTCIGNTGPLARGDLEGHQRQRPVGDRGALGQPQLRGPHLPRREDELPGLPAAGDRLRAGRHHGLRLRDRTARQRQRRQRRLPQGHLAVVEGDLRHHRLARSTRRCSPTATPTCSRATSAGGTCPPRPARPSTGIRSRPMCASPRTSTGCPPSRHRSPTSPAPRVLALLGDSVTTDHISPAGNIKAGTPAAQYLDGERRRPQGLQLLRVAARQPRGDDPRHLRQHPAEKPAARRRLGRLHPRLHPGRTARRPSSTTPRRTMRRRTFRWSCWAARSTARARRATGPPRAPACWACAR